MGYYQSQFRLGWIANLFLAVVFHFVFSSPSIIGLSCWTSTAAAIVAVVVLNWLMMHRREKVEGAVFVTGCDSGMGLVTSIHLAKLGFHVYAGCYNPGASKSLFAEKIKEANLSPEKIEVVPLDVTKTESISNAVDTVRSGIKDRNITPGLVGVINCAGIAIVGPCEYIPMSMYRQLFDVNYFGYVEMTQAMLPLLKESQSAPGSRRGRVVFVGTGGGVMSPAPALLSAYMGSKWAGEAYIQVLRMEMQLRELRIDASMINPGFIKPTNIVAAGQVFLEKMWKAAPPEARDEYQEYVDRFDNYNAAQPGDPPSFIAEAMEEAMLAGRPELSYKVGFDSHAAPYAGSLPTFAREALLHASMFNSMWSNKNKKKD